MAALNISMYVQTEKPQDLTIYYSNSDKVGDAVEASIKVVGAKVPNGDAMYYALVNRTEIFMILVPNGYRITNTYMYNDTSDEWFETFWREVPVNENYYNEMCYHKYNDLATGYTIYKFAEHDVEGELVTRTFALSFNVGRDE